MQRVYYKHYVGNIPVVVAMPSFWLKPQNAIRQAHLFDRQLRLDQRICLRGRVLHGREELLWCRCVAEECKDCAGARLWARGSFICMAVRHRAFLLRGSALAAILALLIYQLFDKELWDGPDGFTFTERYPGGKELNSQCEWSTGRVQGAPERGLA